MNVTAARTLALASAGRLVGGTAPSASRAFSSTAVGASEQKVWKVYLSGEIHSDWREVIAEGVAEKKRPSVGVGPSETSMFPRWSKRLKLFSCSYCPAVYFSSKKLPLGVQMITDLSAPSQERSVTAPPSL